MRQRYALAWLVSVFLGQASRVFEALPDGAVVRFQIKAGVLTADVIRKQSQVKSSKFVLQAFSSVILEEFQVLQCHKENRKLKFIACLSRKTSENVYVPVFRRIRATTTTTTSPP